MNRLWVKLSLAFLAVSLAAIGLVAGLSARATGEQFRQYVVQTGMMAQGGLAPVLEEYYAANGGWTGVKAVLVAAGPGAGGMAGMMMGRGHGAGGNGAGAGGNGVGGNAAAGPNFAVTDSGGRVIASRTGELEGEVLPASVLSQGVPLVVDGQAVGTLLSVRPADTVLDSQGQAFLGLVRQSLLAAVVAAAALSLLLGILISRWLTAPLVRLTRAAHAIATGDLGQRVDVQGRDEIAEVGTAFNRMSAHLAEAETVRKNLLADVSHELRTPLAVLQGDLQAILDGVYPLEMAQVSGLYDETRLLTRLVDDLHELALADAGQMRLERGPVDPVELASAAVNEFAAVADGAGVGLAVDAPDAVPEIMGDAGRLAQVLRNLIGNALRYTPAGGKITVSVAPAGGAASGAVTLRVSDTGSGIAPADLPYVFDRFYGGDKARGRRQGGSAGLGLAIARQLVRAHGGTIEAASGAQGTTFTITLPAAN